MSYIENRVEVVGITGNGCSGKDSIARMFEQRGFFYVSASDILREIIIGRNQSPCRELQTSVANEVRSARGPEYFVVEALGRAVKKPVVVSGIYALSEGQYIQKLGGKIVHVEAGVDEDPAGVLYDRMMNRRDGSRDDMTSDDFMQAYTRENSGAHPGEANVRALSQIADYRVDTSNPPQHCELQVEQILGRIQYAA